VIARLLISTPEERVKEIKNILASHIGSGNTNHPDLLYIKEGEKLGIAEARKIKNHFSSSKNIIDKSFKQNNS